MEKRSLYELKTDETCETCGGETEIAAGKLFCKKCEWVPAFCKCNLCKHKFTTTVTVRCDNQEGHEGPCHVPKLPEQYKDGLWSPMVETVS